MGALPNGIDWADGITPLPIGWAASGPILGYPTGTPAPDASVITDRSSTQVEALQTVEEMSDSPEYERAEQFTVTHKFTMSWMEALAWSNYYPRGAFVTDTYGHLYFVTNCRVQRTKGNQAVVTITMEAKDFDSPPDEFELVPVELGFNIVKHPRYLYAFIGSGYGSTTELLNQPVIRLLQDYMANPSFAFRTAVEMLLQQSIGYLGSNSIEQPAWKAGNDKNPGYPWGYWSGKIRGTDAAKRAALEIVEKYWRGEETPYVVGWQLTWSQYFFRPPYLNPGGYLEDPIYDGQLPPYFWSPSFPFNPNAGTMLDALAYLNPQCYSRNGRKNGASYVSWLRKADEIEYQRTWFKVRHTWIGSAIGFWDDDIYTQGPRPNPNTGEGYRFIITPGVTCPVAKPAGWED